MPNPGSFAAELSSPIKTLLHTRTARGVLAAQTLYNWVAAQPMGNAHFIEFRLDIPETESDPPLGWVLSQAVIRTMDCQLIRPPNRANFEALGRLLRFEFVTFLDELSAECEGT